MPLKIFVDRLKTGKEERWDITVNSSQLFDKEDDVCAGEVRVVGKAYLAGAELVVELEKISASCRQVCVVCNDWFEWSLESDFGRHMIDSKLIRGAVWNMGPLVREEILLAQEPYPRCGGKVCFQQEHIEEIVKVDHGSTT